MWFFFKNYIKNKNLKYFLYFIYILINKYNPDKKNQDKRHCGKEKSFQKREERKIRNCVGGDRRQLIHHSHWFKKNNQTTVSWSLKEVRSRRPEKSTHAVHSVESRLDQAATAGPINLSIVVEFPSLITNFSDFINRSAHVISTQSVLSYICRPNYSNHNCFFILNYFTLNNHHSNKILLFSITPTYIS